MRKVLTIVMLLTAVIALSGYLAPAAAEDMDAAAVVEAVYAAVEAGDIDSAVEMLAEDAVLTLVPPPGGMDGTFVGKEEIAAWFENLAAENGQFEFSDVKTDGNTATMKLVFYGDHFDNIVGGPAEFDGTAIVQNGLWKAVSWALTPEFLAEMGAVMEKQANIELVRRYNEAWEQADSEVLLEVLAEDFVNHSPPLPPARDGMLEFAAEHRAQFPTGEYTIQEITADDDMVFVYGRYQATHDGEPYAGIPASGTEVGFDYTILLRLEEGKIVERWGTSGSIMGMLVPLGFQLVPPTAGPSSAALTAEDILGVWHVLGVDFDFYHKFYDDGTFHAGDSPENLDDEPWAIGEYRFDEGNLVMTELVVTEVPPCGPEPVIYAPELLDSGNLKLTLVQDDCEPRVDATAREHAPVR